MSVCESCWVPRLNGKHDGIGCVHPQPRVKAAAAAAARWPHTDLVLVTAWGRPEFLLGTLQKLAEAVGVEQQHFIFLLDDEYDDRIACIVDVSFPATQLSVRQCRRTEVAA